MLEVITILVGLIVTVVNVCWFTATSDRIKRSAYRYGYNDCLLDIDEILEDWKLNEVNSVGIETMRNRLAQEYMEE